MPYERAVTTWISSFSSFFCDQFWLACVRIQKNSISDTLPDTLVSHWEKKAIDHVSVADPGCLSRIPDLKTETKERGEKKFVVIPFFVTINFTKFKIIFFFEMLKKKIWANLQRIIENFLPKKLSLSSQKYGIGIRDPEKKLFRSRIRNTGSCDPSGGMASSTPGSGAGGQGLWPYQRAIYTWFFSSFFLCFGDHFWIKAGHSD